MRRPDPHTRAAAILALVAASINLLAAWEWSEALAWLVASVWWQGLGALLAVDGLLWVLVLTRGASWVAPVAAWGGLGLSVALLNPITVAAELVVIALLWRAPTEPEDEP